MNKYLIMMFKPLVKSLVREQLQKWLNDPDTTNEKRAVDGAVNFVDYLIENKL